MIAALLEALNGDNAQKLLLLRAKTGKRRMEEETRNSRGMML